MQTQIYIVRIYRRNGAGGAAGLVEVVRSGERRQFHGIDELRRILDLPPAPRSGWHARRGQRD
jgi:hypothetical protein